MKTLEDCQNELRLLEKFYVSHIEDELKSQIRNLTDDFHKHIVELLEKNNLQYGDTSSEDMEEIDDQFEYAKRKNPDLTIEQFINKKIRTEVETFINNTFINQAIKQDPSRDWDGFVRYEYFYKRLFEKE